MKTKAKQPKHRAKKPSSSQLRIKWVAGGGGWGGVGWGGWGGWFGLGLAWLRFVVDYSTLTLTATIFIYSRA